MTTLTIALIAYGAGCVTVGWLTMWRFARACDAWCPEDEPYGDMPNMPERHDG